MVKSVEVKIDWDQERTDHTAGGRPMFKAVQEKMRTDQHKKSYMFIFKTKIVPGR